MATLHFKTVEAANLFQSEIIGQLSDGAWENTRPLDHWKFWANADIVVDGRVGHEGYPMKTNYNLYSLKKWIKDAMKNAIKIARESWFDMKYSDFTRNLTDEIYLRIESPYFTDSRPLKEESWYANQYECLIESSAEEAAKKLGNYVSDEFKDMLKKEVLHQLILSDEKRAEAKKKWNAECQAKLAEIGIKSEEDIHNFIKRMQEVKISDAELNIVLDEVIEMMHTAL